MKAVKLTTMHRSTALLFVLLVSACAPEPVRIAADVSAANAAVPSLARLPAAAPGWRIDRTTADGAVYLNVSPPGENASRTILKSSRPIRSHAISANGQYAA
jgi:hypothetical protein